MSRLLFALTLGLLAISLLACGGGSSKDSDVLQFTGRDETEANFRGRVRETLLSPLSRSICTGLRGLSAGEAAEVLRSDGPGDPAEIPGATPRPGQQAEPKDLVRAAEIVIEECDRID